MTAVRPDDTAGELGQLASIRYRRSRGTTPRPEDVDFLLAALREAEAQRDEAVARAERTERALLEAHREAHRRWGATYRTSEFYRDGLEAVDAILRAAVSEAPTDE